MLLESRNYMKRVSASLVVAFFITLVLARAQSSRSARGSHPRLSLTLSRSVDQIKTGFPVEVTVTLRNISDHTVSVWRENATDQGGHVYRVDVEDEKGSPAPDTKIGRGFKALDDPQPVTTPTDTPLVSSGGWQPLEPGDFQTDKVNVSRLYDLSRPGKYSIQLRRFDEEFKNFIKSNGITVTVTR
jgi:hypothetical protein